MMHRSFLPTFVLLIYPAIGVCLASPGAALLLQTGSLENSAWTFADFDGDKAPDFATARPRSHGGYVLELELSSRRLTVSLDWPALPSLPSAFGLHVLTQDVDGDQDLDIIITWGFARLPVAVWINDGQGQFAEASIQTYPGRNRPDSSLCPKSSPNEWQVMLSPSRQFGFSLEPGDRLLRPFLGSSDLFASGPQPCCSIAHPDQRCARAPPATLFS